MSQQEIENPISKRCWHEKELKKILDYMANGDSLYLELSKNAIEGVLKIEDEIIPVYVSVIDLKNLAFNCEPGYVTANGKMEFPENKIVRKFVLMER